MRTAYDMTPEQYREKWGLAPDYPMVAPNYAAQRSALARSSGLGQQRKGKAAAVPEKPSKTARKPAKAVKVVNEPASE